MEFFPKRVWSRLFARVFASVELYYSRRYLAAGSTGREVRVYMRRRKLHRPRAISDAHCNCTVK